VTLKVTLALRDAELVTVTEIDTSPGCEQRMVVAKPVLGTKEQDAARSSPA
jgi:hypothetical protein